jgi:DNA-directed RNA polymerase subunit RPC12/RpoP
MAVICPHCGSADTTAMLGDQFQCLECGKKSDDSIAKKGKVNGPKH